MSLLAATEFPSKAVRNLANLTASSAAFQALVGAASEAVALNSIYWPEALDRLVEGEIPEPPPRCIIGSGSAGGMFSQGPGSYWDAGVLFWSLELIVPAQTSFRNRMTWFMNAYGAVVREMFENMRAGGERLHIRSMPIWNDEEISGGPAPLDEDEKPPEIEADIWRVIYLVEY